MPSNLDRYKEDLDSLITRGNWLHVAMVADCSPEMIKNLLLDPSRM